MSGEGMGDFVTALTAGISSDAMWGEITKAAPLIITVTVVALGLYVVRRVVKKASKGKGGF